MARCRQVMVVVEGEVVLGDKGRKQADFIGSPRAISHSATISRTTIRDAYTCDLPLRSVSQSQLLAVRLNS